MDIDLFEEPLDNERYLALARKYAGGARTFVDESPELDACCRQASRNREATPERLRNLLENVEVSFMRTDSSRRSCLETLDRLTEASDSLTDRFKLEKNVTRIQRHLSWMHDVRREANTGDRYHPQARAIVNGVIDEQESYWSRVRGAYERTGLVITHPFLLRVLRALGRVS